MNQPSNRKVLLIDDTPSIHDDFRKILAPAKPAADLRKVETSLFGEAVHPQRNGFEFDSAFNGREGVATLGQSHQTLATVVHHFEELRLAIGDHDQLGVFQDVVHRGAHQAGDVRNLALDIRFVRPR